MIQINAQAQTKIYLSQDYVLIFFYYITPAIKHFRMIDNYI